MKVIKINIYWNKQKGEKIKHDFEEKISNLEAYILVLNSESLTQLYKILTDLWVSIKNNPSPSRGITAKYQDYNALVVAGRGLIKDTANTSRLVLDPEIESFLLINILTQQLSKATESMGLGRAMGTLALNSGYINSELYEMLDQSYVGLDRDFDVIVTSLAYSAEVNPDLLNPRVSLLSGYSRHKNNAAQC